ncbi:MAG: hypothetical protein EOP61_33890, partial [Sphingomonadales bacterium]
LFGHEQGAFPGAFERRLGSLANADGGTIFLADLVEEDGAAIGVGEAAQPPFERARECALFVPEQFGLDGIGGDSAAIDRDQRAAALCRSTMDRLGQHLLADAAFTFDQDRGRGAGGAQRGVDRLAEDRGCTDDVGKVQRFWPFLGERTELTSLAMRRYGIVERGEQACAGNRLDHHVACAGAHRPHCDINRIQRGHDDDRHVANTVLELAHRMERFLARRPYVDQGDIEPQIRRADHPGRVIGIGRLAHAPSGALSQRGDQTGLGRLAVDEQ